MGKFAETANADYHLLFADQGKQTSVSVCSKETEVCCFRFPFATNKQKFAFPFSIYIYSHCTVYTENRTIYICIYIYSIYIYLYFVYFRFKWKTEAPAFFFNPFTICHRTSSSCHLSFCWRRNKQKLCKELNGLNRLNWLAHLCASMIISKSIRDINPKILNRSEFLLQSAMGCKN